MAENVQTGGLMSFNYKNKERATATKEEKDEIDDA